MSLNRKVALSLIGCAFLIFSSAEASDFDWKTARECYQVMLPDPHGANSSIKWVEDMGNMPDKELSKNPAQVFRTEVSKDEQIRKYCAIRESPQKSYCFKLFNKALPSKGIADRDDTQRYFIKIEPSGEYYELSSPGNDFHYQRGPMSRSVLMDVWGIDPLKYNIPAAPSVELSPEAAKEVYLKKLKYLAENIKKPQSEITTAKDKKELAAKLKKCAKSLDEPDLQNTICQKISLYGSSCGKVENHTLQKPTSTSK